MIDQEQMLRSDVLNADTKARLWRRILDVGRPTHGVETVLCTPFSIVLPLSFRLKGLRHALKQEREFSQHGMPGSLYTNDAPLGRLDDVKQTHDYQSPRGNCGLCEFNAHEESLVV